eukprot:TRINITY_DN3417_c0_g1_i1.p1 TRINITY_DN3417_c0_g1~~TRINITY_DN3417_c0_g1_i1.p1  ORF type:complete len:385 (+),score=79.76 TRINITY_DN3417_c0_g1_i1:102-1157(+)
MAFPKVLCLVVLLSASVMCGPPYPIPPFDCPTLPNPGQASNVRQLRAGNIKVVMAMGDSITAGFAMKGHLPEDFLEYRGHVYSIGGDKSQITIPNWLGHYAKDVQGAAKGDTRPLIKGAWLDAAVSGARIEEMPPQVEYLVNTLRTEYNDTVDFENDWKLLTLFIGANNICPSCTNSSHGWPTTFESSLRQTLDKIHAEIPRVFVNMLTIFNISGVWYAGQTKLYCRELWQHVTQNECGCLTTGNETDLLLMDMHSVWFNAITEKVAAEYAALGDPHFTTVAQPGVSGFDIPFFGEHYLSTLDCFHPSLWANQAFTLAIWNNMFQPVGSKSTTLDAQNLTIICPDENSFLQ